MNAPSNHFDLIVVGCGGIGSAVVYYAAERGLRVLGLEQFEPVHARGSSHGQTRVIRQAYFEHPDYVPLLKRAYSLWQLFQQRVDSQLYYRTGLLEVGPESGVLIQGVRQSAALHSLPLESVDREQFADRFRGFVLPEDSVAVFESDAGFLMVEDCIRHYLSESRRLGSTLQFGKKVVDWTVSDDEVCVQTESNQYFAPRLIITMGSWANDLLGRLGLQLTVLRKHLHWYQTATSNSYLLKSDSPTFFYETSAGYFYGFPAFDERGVKVAQHSGGEFVADPFDVNRCIDAEERGQVERFLQAHMPQVAFPATDHAVCMYTMSPDEHFIVDRHPEYPQVAFAAGLSGHGFKFASVLGESLVQLAVDGNTSLPMAFLSLNRFRKR